MNRSLSPPIFLSSYFPSGYCAFRLSGPIMTNPKINQQSAKMLLPSRVLLSIIVVASVSLTELIGVREGTAA